MLQLLLHFHLFLSASAIFSSNSLVSHLTKKNFDNLVVHSERVWFVKFYAPWCGHCQEFAPEFERAAKALKGVVRLGAVNADDENDLADRFGVDAYPAVKIFIVDKKKPEDFRGERNTKTLVDAAMSAVQRKVNHQLSGKPDAGPRSHFRDVVKLTDNNFKHLVLNSNDMWMINFYAPWCQTCQRFEPIYAEVATELKGKVKFGAVDVTVNRLTADHYKIEKYPTIKYFPVGFKKEIFDYNLKRNKNELVEFAMKTFLDSKPAKKIKQIINNNTLEKVCAEEQLCVISFLPHILDCSGKCRRAYLKILRKNSEKFKERLWGWLWSEATAQTQLEKAFDIGGFGYPAMVVLNINKMKYTTMRGAFSEEGIGEFLRDLSYGRGSVADLKSKIEIVEVKAWDGTDSSMTKDHDKDEELSDNVVIKTEEEIDEEIKHRHKSEKKKIEKKEPKHKHKDLDKKSSENEKHKETKSKMKSKTKKNKDDGLHDIKKKDSGDQTDCDSKEKCEKPNLKDTLTKKLSTKDKAITKDGGNKCTKEQECSAEKDKSLKHKKSSGHKEIEEDEIMQEESKSEKKTQRKNKKPKKVIRDKEDDMCSVDGGTCEKTILKENEIEAKE